MYCVIQEIGLKKPNKCGYSKELKTSTFTINGVTKYCYNYGYEYFERPIKKAYKISVHESKRINGVVTKKQYAVTTMSYYDIVEFWLGDCVSDKKIDDIAQKLNTTYDNLIEVIYKKLEPLEQKIKAEFKKTEEYKTHTKHNTIIKKYLKQKAKFAKTYGCDESEYDYCYSVFGELMNNDYFSKVVNEYKSRRSYQEHFNSNYNNYDWGGFGSGYNNSVGLASSAYTDTEKAMLKKFYRTLSREYHPDIARNDGEEMKLINRLKESWGI